MSAAIVNGLQSEGVSASAFHSPSYQYPIGLTPFLPFFQLSNILCATTKSMRGPPPRLLSPKGPSERYTSTRKSYDTYIDSLAHMYQVHVGPEACETWSVYDILRSPERCPCFGKP